MDIKPGQLVRIVGFHRLDVMKYARISVIGQTGRFLSCWPSTWGKNAVRGIFMFEPDELNQNDLNPAFTGVYVEPVEVEHEEKSG